MRLPLDIREKLPPYLDWRVILMGLLMKGPDWKSFTKEKDVMQFYIWAMSRWKSKVHMVAKGLDMVEIYKESRGKGIHHDMASARLIQDDPAWRLATIKAFTAGFKDGEISDMLVERFGACRTDDDELTGRDVSLFRKYWCDTSVMSQSASIAAIMVRYGLDEFDLNVNMPVSMRKNLIMLESGKVPDICHLDAMKLIVSRNIVMSELHFASANGSSLAYEAGMAFQDIAIKASRTLVASQRVAGNESGMPDQLIPDPIEPAQIPSMSDIGFDPARDDGFASMRAAQLGDKQEVDYEEES